jgi:hypothetical protein
MGGHEQGKKFAKCDRVETERSKAEFDDYNPVIRSITYYGLPQTLPL